MNVSKAGLDDQVKTEGERRASMTWAKRLKRAFNIDIEICESCGGSVKVVACIEDPEVIKKILVHLNLEPANPSNMPNIGNFYGHGSRSPP